MADTSMIEMAANLREQARKTRAAIDDLRAAGGDWTTHMLLVSDVEEIAAASIRSAWSAMTRVEHLVLEALAAKGNP